MNVSCGPASVAACTHPGFSAQDTWAEYGLGANFNITDSTYVWADVERTAGGVLDADWRATVGVRYSF